MTRPSNARSRIPSGRDPLDRTQASGRAAILSQLCAQGQSADRDTILKAAGLPDAIRLEGKRAIVDWLRRALRKERARARAGQPGTCQQRHLALWRSLIAEINCRALGVAAMSEEELGALMAPEEGQNGGMADRDSTANRTPRDPCVTRGSGTTLCLSGPTPLSQTQSQ